MLLDKLVDLRDLSESNSEHQYIYNLICKIWLEFYSKHSKY